MKIYNSIFARRNMFYIGRWMGLLLAAALPGVAPAAEKQGALSRPNIMVILADDLGYGDLGCYPHLNNISTPNIDQLAASGVRMTQAYAQPVCSPTRISLLTGYFPQRVGGFDNMDGEGPGIGTAYQAFVPRLQAAGYRTAWFGKWHQGWDVSNHPLNNGFDVAYGFLGGMHDYYVPTIGHHHNGGAYATQAYVLDGFKPVRKMGYLTTDLTARAVEFIRQSGKNPFFIYLAYNAPHTPIQAPDELVLKHLKAGLPPEEATYRAMIDVLDAGIGQVTAALKECGLEKDTLVVFTSDNGAEVEHRNGGLRGTKMTAWEGGVRVPMIASWPGKISADITSDAMCAIPDLAATCLALGGVEGEAHMDGVNLMPFWTGQRQGNAHEALVWSIILTGPTGTRPTPDNMELFAVRMGPWKLVRDSKRNIDALYDLDKDLRETNDLSAPQPQKKAELLAYGTDFLKQCPPSAGRIAREDKTLELDKQMYVDMAERCRKLLEKETEKTGAKK
jgi:arylsulfatase A-like enzyme